MVTILYSKGSFGRLSIGMEKVHLITGIITLVTTNFKYGNT